MISFMVGFQQTRAGQTLLEAIVAIGILTTSIASALTLSTVSLSAEQDALSAATGGNLAREAIEAVRVIRDSNWLAEIDFDEGLYQGTTNPDYTGVPVLNPDTGDWSIDFQPSGTSELPYLCISSCRIENHHFTSTLVKILDSFTNAHIPRANNQFKLLELFQSAPIYLQNQSFIF